jgi:hypothetical protein
MIIIMFVCEHIPAPVIKIPQAAVEKAVVAWLRVLIRYLSEKDVSRRLTVAPVRNLRTWMQ